MSSKQKIIKVDLVKKLQSKKVLIFISVVVLGFTLAIQGSKNNTSKKNTAVPSSFTSLASPIPIQKTSSERALKAAAWVLANSSQKETNDLVAKYPEFGGKTKAQMVEIYAVKLDNYPAGLALIEADMQKPEKDGQVSQTMIDTSKIERSIRDSNNKLQDIQNCQDEMARYQECVNDYTNKLAEYTQCLSTGSSDLSSYKYCFKPFNSCSKPYCN